MSDTIKAGLIERLGVKDANISDEELLAALDETLDEQADPNPGAAATGGTLPPGAIVVDKASYEELQNNSAAGRRAMDAIDNDRRERVISDALRSGRITKASADGWRAQIAKDEAGITALLASFPKNQAVPVTEIGKSDDVTDAESALYAQAWGTDEKTEA